MQLEAVKTAAASPFQTAANYLFSSSESCNKLEPFQNSRELVFLLTDNLEFSRKITKV
jgi:hypothetical protein